MNKIFIFFLKNKMNEFIFLSLENIDDILIFSRMCKKGNEIYKKWEKEWYTIHTQIVFSVDEYGDKRETKIIGNRKYVTILYEDGNKKCKKEYKDGKFEGKWIGWHRDGTNQYEGEYKDGKQEGKWIWWWENGNKECEGEYKNGKEEGKWIMWWDNGTVQCEKEYENGEEKGKCSLWWYRDGTAI